jgi:uncharacterized protein
MSRLLSLLVIAAAIYFILRTYRRQAPAEKPVEDMVKCARCGIYLPAGESVSRDGKHYCSEAHRDAQ